MKIYVATKFTRKEEVLEIYKKLREHGHEITTDWTVHELDPKRATEYAEEDMRGVQECEVLTHLSHSYVLKNVGMRK